MKIPSGEGVGILHLSLKSIAIPTTCGFATRGELKLPFVTRGKFIIPTTCGFATRGRNYTIPTPPPEGIEAMTLTSIDCRPRKSGFAASINQ